MEGRFFRIYLKMIVGGLNDRRLWFTECLFTWALITRKGKLLMKTILFNTVFTQLNYSISWKNYLPLVIRLSNKNIEDEKLSGTFGVVNRLTTSKLFSLLSKRLSTGYSPGNDAFWLAFFRPTWIYLKCSQTIGNRPRIKFYIMLRGAFILGGSHAISRVYRNRLKRYF